MPCTQMLVVKLRPGRRSSGLRDELHDGDINCYEVHVPRGTSALKLGMRILSGTSPHHANPGVKVVAIKGRPGTSGQEQELRLQTDDDDVAYDRIWLGGSGS